MVMANQSMLCSHENYNVDIRGLESEKKESARSVRMGYLEAVAFQLGFHMAELRKP